MHPKRTSYRQIAAAAGVSHMTLYRVLNHAPNVTEATREKVIRIMKQLGCIDARLPSGCSVVIYADANNYMCKYADILARKLHDFPVTVRQFHAERNKSAFLRMIETASSLVYFEFMPERLLEECRERNPDLKIICINGSEGDINIGCDYFQQGRMAAEYIHSRGFRNLGIVLGKYAEGNPFYPGLYDRAMGCLHYWMYKYGHDKPELILDLDSCFAEKRSFPSVFFAVNTHLSDRLIQTAEQHHLKLLKDYSLLTVGRPEDDLNQHPDVDCVYHEPKDMLEIAVSFLFNPNLNKIHSKITINVQNNLKSYGTVRSFSRS